MNIVVLDGHTLNPGDNSWTAVKALGELVVHERTDPVDVVARAASADVLLTNKTALSASDIAQLPRLKFISLLATGFNVVDVAAARERDIPVSNVPVYGPDTVAQYVFASILHSVHDIGRHDAAIRQGKWGASQDFSFWLTPLRELSGATLGVVGFGRIGRRTAEIAKAFGMRVLAHDVACSNAPQWPGFRWCDLDELFSESDFVTLHCPLTKTNGEFVNRSLLGKMKPEAILVNAARGALIHEADLADALNSGKIAGAVLDVVSREPIDDDNPLLHAKNCVLTPHMAWAALQARQRLMATTAENIEAFLRGQPINLVN